MKFYLIAAVAMILFSSCLKQSIPDAMLDPENSGKGGTTATLSYEFNGSAVNISVDDADNQSVYPYYTLGCSKGPGYYNLSGMSNTGEITFTFYSDSLTVGTYRYATSYDDPFVTSYNGENEYLHAPSDSITVNITSYEKGHISGNFSGALTPMITAGNPYNTYGTPSSVLITKGSFKNIPVYY
jgi:hypothetical protein